MNFGRIQKMYGDKPPLYALSAYILFFGWGWIVAQHGVLGIGDIILRSCGWFFLIYIVDGVAKGIFFIKEHFSISLKLNFKEEERD